MNVPISFQFLQFQTNRLFHCTKNIYCRFCGLKGHEMFCEVERSYIEDGFNLYGLRACVSNFSDCLDLILDRIGPDDSDDSHLTQSACTLYGLIHARYIITAHGLDAMYNKVCMWGVCVLWCGRYIFLFSLCDMCCAEYQRHRIISSHFVPS